MGRLGLALLAALGLACASSGPPPPDPAWGDIDPWHALSLEGEAQIEYLRARLPRAATIDPFAATSGAPPAFVHPAGSQGPHSASLPVRYSDPNSAPSLAGRRLQFVGRPQARPWWVSIAHVDLGPGEAAVRWSSADPWQVGCVEYRARFVLPLVDAPSVFTAWSNSLEEGDCIDPAPVYVPEPRRLALLASGGAVLVALNRRRSTHA